MRYNKTASDTCQVCSRYAFGEIVPLGFGHWRHWGCAPGSFKWVENYPLNAHTPEGDLLYDAAIKRKSNGN